MNRCWPAEALAFEESVDAALKALGGIELTRACERDPDLRTQRLAPQLAELGFEEVALSAGEVEAAACALGAMAAGRYVVPWPLAHRLVARSLDRTDVEALYLVRGAPRRADHLDVAGPALALDLISGDCRRLEPTAAIAPMPIDPFGVPCHLGEPVEVPFEVVCEHIVLSAFWGLGAMETAVSLASAYTNERTQFGRPIGSFGAIQWRLSDLSIGYSALMELAGFTLAKLIDRTITLADAFALRLQMLESCSLVLANAHQVFGAIGLCEEHDLALVDRHMQSTLRRPLGRAATAAALSAKVAAEGFDLVYPVPPRGSFRAPGAVDGALAPSG